MTYVILYKVCILFFLSSYLLLLKSKDKKQVILRAKKRVKQPDLFSLICAMRCDEAEGSCNAFRIFKDYGICKFGFITPALEEAKNGPEIEVYIRSIFFSNGLDNVKPKV